MGTALIRGAFPVVCFSLNTVKRSSRRESYGVMRTLVEMGYARQKARRLLIDDIWARRSILMRWGSGMTGIGLAGRVSSIPGASSTTLRPGRPGVYRVNAASNDVAGDAARSADEDMLEQLCALLGTGGHIVSAHALLRASFSRSLFGFSASATQLRSSAGLGFHG